MNKHLDSCHNKFCTGCMPDPNAPEIKKLEKALRKAGNRLVDREELLGQAAEWLSDPLRGCTEWGKDVDKFLSENSLETVRGYG